MTKNRTLADEMQWQYLCNRERVRVVVKSPASRMASLLEQALQW